MGNSGSKKKCTAIVLAAGQGSRMGTHIQKQYINLNGKPLICYSLEVFERSGIIDETVLVAGKGQEEYCRSEIVQKYGFGKVRIITEGGKERYHSVMNGLHFVDDGYVFIHDGARPFVSEDIIRRTYEEVKTHGACAAGMPVKDTIKIADADGFAKDTPDRKTLWQIQTPQVFEASVIKEAYARFMEKGGFHATDDAMIAEQMLGMKVKLVPGSYENIKITTPGDMQIAAGILQMTRI